MMLCIGVSSLCVTLAWSLSPVTGSRTFFTWTQWKVSMCLLCSLVCKAHAAQSNIVGKYVTWLFAVQPINHV